MVEYTLPPMPPISGFIASSFDNPTDENEDTVPAVDTGTSMRFMTTTGTLSTETSLTIAAPALLEMNAEGMKRDP